VSGAFAPRAFSDLERAFSAIRETLYLGAEPVNVNETADRRIWTNGIANVRRHFAEDHCHDHVVWNDRLSCLPCL
jgi:hypothetical protein